MGQAFPAGRAQVLLEKIIDKLPAAAPEFGYESAHASSRAFTRFVGFTPSQFHANR